MWIVFWFSLALARLASVNSVWVTAVEIGGKRGGTAAAIVNTAAMPAGHWLRQSHLGQFTLGWSWGSDWAE